MKCILLCVQIQSMQNQTEIHVCRYSPEELKYFPLNTSLFDPPKKVDASAEQQVEDDEESQVDKVVLSHAFYLLFAQT